MVLDTDTYNEVDDQFALAYALPWLPGSLLGAYLGSRLMPKISTGWLKLVFGGLMLWGGIRLL